MRKKTAAHTKTVKDFVSSGDYFIAQISERASKDYATLFIKDYPEPFVNLIIPPQELI